VHGLAFALGAMHLGRLAGQNQLLKTVAARVALVLENRHGRLIPLLEILAGRPGVAALGEPCDDTGGFEVYRRCSAKPCRCCLFLGWLFPPPLRTRLPKSASSSSAPPTGSRTTPSRRRCSPWRRSAATRGCLRCASTPTSSRSPKSLSRATKKTSLGSTPSCS